MSAANKTDDVSDLVAQIAADGLKTEPIVDNTDNYPKMVFGKECDEKCDGSLLAPTHLFVPKQVTNRHVVRRLDNNITLLRYLRSPEKTLEPDQYFARMHFNPEKSTPMNIDGETGLDCLSTGRVVISKRWSCVYLPIPNTAVALIEVTDPNLCLVLK